MKVFNSLQEVKDVERCVVALGNFDGVHNCLLYTSPSPRD